MEKGIVASLAQPGGNATGLQIQVSWGKLLQLLKEAVPTVSRVVMLHDPATSPGDALGTFLRRVQSAAQAQNVAVQPVAVSDQKDIPGAFAEFGRGTNGLMVEPSPPLVFVAQHVATLAVRRRLPATGYGRVFADAGCLMSYGENLGAMYRAAAVYVDKILKGARPGELPVEQPTKFEWIINLKTARALGMSIPSAVVARADQVIE